MNKEVYLGQFKNLKAGDEITAPDKKGVRRKGRVMEIGAGSYLVKTVMISCDNGDIVFHSFQPR